MKRCIGRADKELNDLHGRKRSLDWCWNADRKGGECVVDVLQLSAE